MKKKKKKMDKVKEPSAHSMNWNYKCQLSEVTFDLPRKTTQFKFKI
jgi:hypothetical protein